MQAETVITLSREETLLVTRLLQAQGMFGLKPDPNDITARERQQSMLQAERSLRARGLARLGTDGRLKLLSPLIDVLATCIYPEHSMIIHHWAGDNTLTQCFGHVRETHQIAHIQPQAYLHQFVHTKTTEQLICRLLEQCHCDQLVAGEGDEIELSHDVLQHLREEATTMEPQELENFLREQGCSEITITNLGAIVSQAYALTIIHSLHPQNVAESLGYAWSIIHNEHGAWLMYQLENTLYRLLPTSTEQLLTTFTSALNKHSQPLAAAA